MSEQKVRLGGMALRNGVLVHGPRHWAVAVRPSSGEPVVRTGTKPRLRVGGARGAPVIRGVAALAEAVMLLPRIRRQAPEAKLAMDSAGARVATGAALVGSLVLRRRLRSPAMREAANAALSLLPAVSVLRDGRVARYHAAEHQAIAAYETGRDAAHTAREHDRCGTNLVVPAIASTAAANFVTSRLRLAGATRSAVGAAVSTAALGALMEGWQWALAHPDTTVGRVLLGPGRLMQSRLTTLAPHQDELALGPLAVDAVVAAERG